MTEASLTLPQGAQEVRQRVVRGVTWATLGTVVAQGGSFLSTIVLARVLGKYVFGQYAMIQSTVYALTNIAGLGLGITATKFVSQYRQNMPEKAGRILGLSSAIALIAGGGFSVGLLFLAPSLAPDLAVVPGLRLSVFYVFFTTLNGYQVGALAGFEAFGRIARIGIFTGLAAVPVAWILATLFGLPGAILSQGFCAFLTWLLYQLGLRSEGRRSGVALQYRGMWRERAAIFQFSIPAVVSGTTSSIAIWWCNKALVGHSGYAELGIFSAVSNLRVMVTFIPAIVARVISPLLNNLLANGNVKAYRRTFWKSVAGNGLIALVMAGFLALLGKEVLRLFGKDFVGTPMLVLFMLFSAVIETVAVNLYQVIFTGRSLWWQVAVNTQWIVILVLSSVLFIPHLGAAGLAQAYLAAWCGSLVFYGVIALSDKRIALWSQTHISA